ncbi:hypothetical protein C8D70_104205 [Chryseobacterium sp. CBTAP 102]|nr:hypothetical protein [Chryseobacterium sp. CBTAP 102]PXW16267.1 hypothetical protein C8D70_104205 [Chryseobacterium sp. CBTAP 102]
MKKNLTVLNILFCSMLFSQVGINTNTPKSTLDVVGKPSDPSIFDGIIAPRITGADLKTKTYTAQQTGALVYVTAADPSPSGQTVDVVSLGYYYFNGDVTINKWIKIAAGPFDQTNDEWTNVPSGSKIEIGKLSDGTTSRPAGTEFIVADNGRTSIGSADNSAMVTINTVNTNSILKLIGLSNSNNKTASSINYNRTLPLHADNNGNIFSKFSITSGSTNALTFDGNYTSTPTAQTLVTTNQGSIVKFTVHSGFAFGVPGSGAVVYGEVVWSPTNKFQCRYYGSAPGTGTNNLTVSGEGTDILTFDFDLGVDFILEKTAAGITYRNTSPSTNIGFSIYDSFRSR